MANHHPRATKAVVDHVDEEDRKMIDGKTQSRFGIELGQRGGWLINESGLYSLILKKMNELFTVDNTDSHSSKRGGALIQGYPKAPNQCVRSKSRCTTVSVPQLNGQNKGVAIRDPL